jgi:TonB-linked SusC/RagA family outer membrane protein
LIINCLKNIKAASIFKLLLGHNINFIKSNNMKFNLYKLVKLMLLCVYVLALTPSASGQQLSMPFKDNLPVTNVSNTEGPEKLGRKIIGQVKEGEGAGESLPGVSIMVKEYPTLGTVTDANGNFALEVPDDAKTLVLSFIGFQTKEVLIENQTVFSIVLDAKDNTLKEVVVIGYGEQKREDVTGSISSIKTADLKTIPQASVDQLMQGRASGVVVTNNSGQPGSATSVRIRGITSLSGSNEPLYVVDGVPISGDANNSGTSGQGAVSSFSLGGGTGTTALSPLATLNPSDILSIDILKDASATAIYGSRASNGVVIITTKRGKKDDSKITYDGFYGIQTPQKYLKSLNLREYAKFQTELVPDYGGQIRVEFSNPELLGEGTNWQRELMKPAAMQSHQLGISGGKDKLQYYFSTGYLKQDGIVAGTGFDRLTARLNLDNQVKTWFKLGTSLTVSRTNEKLALTDDQDGVITSSVLQTPDIPLINLDGTYGGPVIDNGGVIAVNPVAKALINENTVLRNRVLGSVYADLILAKGLTFRTEVGGEISSSKNNQFRPTYKWGRAENPVAIALRYFGNSQYYNLKNYLSYVNTFGKHSVNVVAGHEVQDARWDGSSVSRQGFITNDVRELSVGDKNGQSGDTYAGSFGMESYFARAVYSFSDRYSVTGTVRADGSSKFADGNRWGTFPAFAVGYTLSNEAFMKKQKLISNLKLRVGYGAVGNQDVPGGLFSPTLSGKITGLGTGYATDFIANPNLRWETATQYNAGVDVSLLGGRIDFTVDVYKKVSRDFLYSLPLPSFLGTSGDYTGAIRAPYVNLGEMQNSGVDFAINSRNTEGAFRWTTSLNVSKYVNRVNNISNLTVDGRVLYNTLVVTRTVQNQPISQFYGLKMIGIFRDAETLKAAPRQFGGNIGDQGNSLGDIQYEDVNADGKINDDDRTFIGTPHPDFVGGMTNNFSYKGFDLSLFVSGTLGGKIFNYTRRLTEGMDRLYVNQLETVLDRWSATNPNGSLPRVAGGVSNPNLAISSRYLEDASYLRIQNVTFGYTLPTAWLSKVKVARFRVYASVQNLYTFTKYSGYDPEVGSFNQKALLMNIDNGRYPSPRTVTFGVSVEF